MLHARARRAARLDALALCAARRTGPAAVDEGLIDDAERCCGVPDVGEIAATSSKPRCIGACVRRRTGPADWGRDRTAL